MIANPDKIVNPLTGHIPALLNKFSVWERVISDFINEYDGFENEFQYDFIANYLEEIFEAGIMEINRRETWFNFREFPDQSLIDDYFLDCLNSMPFLLETTVDRYVLRLHPDLHLAYQKRYYEIYPSKL